VIKKKPCIFFYCKSREKSLSVLNHSR